MPLFVLIAILVALISVLIIGLGSALMPLTLSLILAYLLFPVVRYFERRGISRQLSLVFLTLILGIFFIVLGIAVIPHLIRESKELISTLPKNIPIVLNHLQSLSDQWGLGVEINRGELKDFVTSQVSSISGGTMKSFSIFLKGAFKSFVDVVLSIVNLFMIPLFFIYVINDFERIGREVRMLVPKNWQPYMNRYVQKANRVLSGYVRGQILVALFLGVFYSIGLKLVGLKYGVIIGLAAGFLNLVPYVGFLIGVMLTVVTAIAHSSGWGVLLASIGVFGVGQTLEGFYITPKLVGDKVGLSAFATVLALIIGGNLLGFAGMILAIPIFALIKQVYADLVYAIQRKWMARPS